MVIRGTIQNGHVVPSEPLSLPNGQAVFIVTAETVDPQRRREALDRLRTRAVDVLLPDEAFSTDELYDDGPGSADRD